MSAIIKKVIPIVGGIINALSLYTLTLFCTIYLCKFTCMLLGNNFENSFNAVLLFLYNSFCRYYQESPIITVGLLILAYIIGFLCWGSFLGKRIIEGLK